MRPCLTDRFACLFPNYILNIWKSLIPLQVYIDPILPEELLPSLLEDVFSLSLDLSFNWFKWESAKG